MLISIAAIIITEIVALSPSSLEQTKQTADSIDPQSLVENNEFTLAPGIPKGRIAEYTVEKFSYVSVQNGVKQWKIEADKAFMYNPEKLVHSRNVRALLFDSEGKITKVTGMEAKYFMNQRDLEIFGNVKTVFPDGFELYSEYLQYLPKQGFIRIPNQYLAKGVGQEKDGNHFQFTSFGLDYDMQRSLIQLHQKVKVTFEKADSQKFKKGESSDVTTIESDHCSIDRRGSVAHFTMNPKRPLNERFVYITQPNLFARSRRADLSYGNISKVLQYLTTYDDVLIKEMGGEKVLRYSTSGRADFNAQKNVIILTQFPQVYQNEDTVTGDPILLHRDTDIIEIENSNSFSQGLENDN
jgi:LPS export ABC transporter protein LptC